VARISLIVLTTLGVVIGLVFAFDPSFDVRTAFFLMEVASRPAMHPVVAALEFLRETGPFLIVAAVAPAVVALAVKMFRLRWPAPMTSRAALFLLLSLAIGPGLLVNGGLKEGWSRPRPGDVINFGGSHAFMPWWDPRGGCDSNCSFVSGETSSATWLAAPAMLVPPPWRYAALGAVAVYTTSIGVARMMAGGHFLSDVLFAAILTGLVIWCVHGALYRWFAARVTEAAIDRFLARVGSTLLRPFSAPPRSRGARPNEPPV
jgi:lipid A 4'-phosphatase